MAYSTGANPLNSYFLLAAFENENLRIAVLLCGATLFGTGLILFHQHLQYWRQLKLKQLDSSRRLFELRKFRRRSAVAFLIATAGSAMSGIYWAIDVRVVAMLALILFASLVGVLGLAMLDLMSVSIRRYAEDDDSARQELVREYHRLKAQKKLQETSNGPEEPDPS